MRVVLSWAFPFPCGTILLPGVLCLLLVGAWECVAAETEASSQAAGEKAALDKVSSHRGIFLRPPRLVPTRKLPDGPLLGNGDVGVVIGGVVERLKYHGLGKPGGAEVTTRELSAEQCPERHRFWIAKNDFWKTKEVYPNAHPCVIGGMDLSIPALVGGKYHAEQILVSGEVEQVWTTEMRVEDPPPFTRAGTEIRARSWVAATENWLVVELSVAGDAQDRDPFRPTSMVGVDLNLWAMTGNESQTATGNLQDGYWAVRRFENESGEGKGGTFALESKPLKKSSEAALAMRAFQHRVPGLPWSRGDGWAADRFVLAPGAPVTMVVSIVSQEDAVHPVEEAKRRVAGLTWVRVEELKKAHRQWWRDFWSRSFVDVGDALIERYYYGSLYLMASCSRNLSFPPSLFGNWTTMDGPAWQADYHLNYNHEAPWWGVFSSNHPELADPYDAPILDYLAVGKANAKELLGIRGVYYDVGMGPQGLETSFMPDGHSIPGEGRRMFLGQKSNAAFAAVNMFMRFEHTYDLDYARKVYPFLREVAEFWEDYLKLENGRYVITKDASGEVGDGGSDRNNCLSLGLVRNLFRGMLMVSEGLGVDEGKRSQWKNILEKLSAFPTVEVDGVRRIRGADSGPAASRIGPGRDNTRIEIMGMVWPSTIVGLGSDPEILDLLKEDVKGWADSEWIGHFNGFSMTFPGAVRVGHDPQDILDKLRKQIEFAGLPNLMIFGGGGGIENCSGVPSTVNEMLLQSHQGTMRLFPVWPRQRDARFFRLRTSGAFLVSARWVNGRVVDVRVESEKGRECVMENPWGEKQVSWVREDGVVQKSQGRILRWSTRPGSHYRLE